MPRYPDLLAEYKKDVIDRCPFRRPHFVLPDPFIPSWSRLPLDGKVPAKSNPKDPLVFSRPKLGKTLYRTFSKKDFDSSPFRDLPLDYDPLHDSHLRRYFRINERNYIHLVKHGYVSPFQDTVNCTQAQFNHYRKYIRSIIVQEEKERRRAQEKQALEESIQREEKRIHEIKSRPLVWLKKQLRLRKKHRIKMLDELEGKEPSICSIEDDEDNVYLDKHRQKLKFLVQENAVKCRLEDKDALKEERELLLYKRRGLKEEEKRLKDELKWHRSAESELVNLRSLDELRAKYEEEFWNRAHEKTKRHFKIWSKYRGLDLKNKTSERYENVWIDDEAESPDEEIITELTEEPSDEPSRSVEDNAD